MRLIRMFILLSLMGIGSLVVGRSNRMINFAIHHCVAQDCVVARGHEAFFNYNSRMLSASHVTLETWSLGRRKLSYSCMDFQADLLSDFYVCDNRDGHIESLTIDDRLRTEKY